MQRILDGACPRRLEGHDEGPWRWLCWLHAYLDGLPVAASLSRAMSNRIDDPGDRVVGAVLMFFRRSLAADGIERVVARAESDLDATLVGHVVPEIGYRPSLWDVMIAAMQQRTDVNDALDLRVIEVVRKVMLLRAGDVDEVKKTLANCRSPALITRTISRGWLRTSWRSRLPAPVAGATS